MGKNHFSPMNCFKSAFRNVLSTRFPTMAKATSIPRLRKSATMSWITWHAVESMETTGVISKTMYSVGLTSMRSLTYVNNMSLTKDAFAKYNEEPMRQMKTLGMKVPLLSCFMFR